MDKCSIKECEKLINTIFKTGVGEFGCCKRHYELILERCRILDKTFADFKAVQALKIIAIDPTETSE